MDLASRFIVCRECISVDIYSHNLLLTGCVRLSWGWGHCNLSISDLETDKVQHEYSESVESNATIFIALNEFPQFITQLIFMLIGRSIMRDETHFS